MQSSILVDSSVWISFFKNTSGSERFERYLSENRVVVNEIILTELIPFLIFSGHTKEADLLSNIQKIPLSINWNAIRLQQYTNKKNGINGVGIPDLIIFEQAKNKNISLWSNDKHFKLMNSQNEITLFTPEPL